MAVTNHPTLPVPAPAPSVSPAPLPDRRGTAPRCLGREAELGRLTELYRECRQGGERLAIVEGPSGVGKTRLLEAFRSQLRLDGGVVFEGRCEPGQSFGPFAAIVDRALAFLSDMSLQPTIDLRDLGCFDGCHSLWHRHEAAGDDLALREGRGSREARERRLRFFGAVRGLLRDVARVRPPVIILHDLERADEATLQLVSFVFDGSGPWADSVSPERSLKALFVASVITGDGSDLARLAHLREHEAASIVRLGPLAEDGLRALLADPHTVRQVLERTGGLPEAVELLLEADPLSAATYLERRLDRLPADARHLLEALAVVQRPTGLGFLAEIAEVNPDPAARDAFAECELVHRTILDGRLLFTFGRDGQRAATYSRIPQERRRQLHRRCAQRFTDGSGPAASHALAAGDTARALELALDEARALAGRHAHADGAALLERVLEAAEGEGPVALHQHLAELYRVVGEYRRALEHAEVVRAANPEDAVASHRVGRLLTLAGQPDDAAERLEEAHALALAANDPVTKVTVEAQLAELHYVRAGYDEAERWASRAAEGAAGLADVRLELHARNTLGKVALARKEPADAEALFQQNERLAREASLGHQEAQALTNLGVAQLRQQKLLEAQRCFTEAVQVARDVNDSRERAIATENLAVLAHLQRHYAEALDHYHQAVALLKHLGNRAMLTRVGINLGELYLSLGDAQRSRALCAFAQHVGGSDLPASFAAEVLLLRGRVDTAEGRDDRAEPAIRKSLEMLGDLGKSTFEPHLELLKLHLRAGRVGEARATLAALPPDPSPKRQAEVAIAAVDHARASGGDVALAARRAARLAEAAADDDELRLEALIRLVHVLCEQGEADAAIRSLEEAQGIETMLSRRVPPEALHSWSRRPTRVALERVEGLVAASAKTEPKRVAKTAPAQRTRSTELDRRYPDIAGASPATVRMLTVVDKVAPSDALVLVRGESGTGKELIAEALHRHSPRRDKPLVKVNCAALVETLLLSELFGHERGAFTGASARKKGRFELADGGTLFLDEIGDISAKTQVALLRVLQEQEFERVGGTTPIRVDVRIIAATHRDLEKMVEAGTFREDLYYRLRGVSVEVPALRERRDDLPELCGKLLQRVAEERGETPKQCSPEVLTLLRRHRWPGNVRELENVLRSATLFADGDTLTRQDLAAFAETFDLAEMEEAALPATGPSAPPEDTIYARIKEGSTSLLEMKKIIERECIVRALTETDGNITRAAKLLGMKRPRLSQLVKQYGLGGSANTGHTVQRRSS